MNVNDQNEVKDEKNPIAVETEPEDLTNQEVSRSQESVEKIE